MEHKPLHLFNRSIPNHNHYLYLSFYRHKHNICLWHITVQQLELQKPTHIRNTSSHVIQQAGPSIRTSRLRGSPEKLDLLQQWSSNIQWPRTIPIEVLTSNQAYQNQTMARYRKRNHSIHWPVLAYRLNHVTIFATLFCRSESFSYWIGHKNHPLQSVVRKPNNSITVVSKHNLRCG